MILSVHVWRPMASSNIPVDWPIMWWLARNVGELIYDLYLEGVFS